jgi:tRNA(Arg) A34 adenosine deaminase TadA
VGVNLVVPSHFSILHAEVVAWSVAQLRLGTYDLATYGDIGLYSSAQPCVACWGGIFWAGISRLVYAASRFDVENLAGFDEGPIPSDWQERLQSRGIAVEQMCQSEAAVILSEYKSSGGAIYNAKAK